MRLTKAQRILSARVAGVAANYLAMGGGRTRDECLRRQSDLEHGRDPHGLVAEAVKALHDVSTDPVVLTDAAAMYSPGGNDYWYGRAALLLLAAAGADLDEAAQIKAGRGRGWVTPQADPVLHRRG